MKRYTITNSGLSWQIETEDLYAFYASGLPAEFIDAEITEVDITEEIAQRKLEEDQKKQKKEEKAANRPNLEAEVMALITDKPTVAKLAQALARVMDLIEQD